MTRISVTQPGEPVAARRRSSRVEPASVPVDRLSWLWLAIAVALLPFSTVHAELPLAAWFAPIFVLRFAHTQSIRVGAPVIPLVTSAGLVVLTALVLVRRRALATQQSVPMPSLA